MVVKLQFNDNDDDPVKEVAVVSGHLGFTVYLTLYFDTEECGHNGDNSGFRCCHSCLSE